MPLMKGAGKDVIAENIREMVKNGHPHAQAVAAAMHIAGKGYAPRKKSKLKRGKALRGDQ